MASTIKQDIVWLDVTDLVSIGRFDIGALLTDE